jgi:RNA polymerase sigma-70 factor, ECF subfamily
VDDLETIFRRYEREIYIFMLRVRGDAHDAEDLTQETFFRACKAARRFKGDSSVRTWLFGIARKVLLEAFRRRRESSLEDVDRPDRITDPTDAIFLQAALLHISVEDREIVMLADALGFSGADLAEMFDITAEAARVRLHRARGRLRAVVESMLTEEQPDG